MANYSAIKYNFNLPTGTTNGSGNNLELIKTLTASSSANLTLINGASSVVLDNTYKTYLIKFINIHPQTDNVHFKMDGTTDGSNFNVNQHNTIFAAGHNEGGDSTLLEYRTGQDVANATGPLIVQYQGGSADESFSGEMFLYNPSSTTFVKHYTGRFNEYHRVDYTFDIHVAGYFNNASALTGLKFQFSSGNIDAGTIKLYGIR
tara:strand:+ start:487 stop:1098 length:612 start_codon:yes stop_codon:yes gene_type:complete